jgi:hypothetical protein
MCKKETAIGGMITLILIASFILLVRDGNTTTKMESAPTWELLWRALQKDNLIFWVVFDSLCTAVVNVVIMLIILQFIRLFWRRKDERAETRVQVQKLLQEGEIFLQDMKTTMEAMGEVKQKYLAEFRNEMDSFQMMMMTKKMEDQRNAQIHEEMDLDKKMVDASVLRAKKRSRIPLRSQTNPNCAGNSNLRD